jgi:hypothetical protein
LCSEFLGGRKCTCDTNDPDFKKNHSASHGAALHLKYINEAFRMALSRHIMRELATHSGVCYENNTSDEGEDVDDHAACSDQDYHDNGSDDRHDDHGDLADQNRAATNDSSSIGSFKKKWSDEEDEEDD